MGKAMEGTESKGTSSSSGCRGTQADREEARSIPIVVLSDDVQGLLSANDGERAGTSRSFSSEFLPQPATTTSLYTQKPGPKSRKKPATDESEQRLKKLRISFFSKSTRIQTKEEKFKYVECNDNDLLSENRLFVTVPVSHFMKEQSECSLCRYGYNGGARCTTRQCKIQICTNCVIQYFKIHTNSARLGNERMTDAELEAWNVDIEETETGSFYKEWKCPWCRKVDCLEPDEKVKNLVQGFKMPECPFTMCKKKLDIPTFEKHLLSCEFSEFSCPFEDVTKPCNFSGLASKFTEHLKKAHPRVRIETSTKFTINRKYNQRFGFGALVYVEDAALKPDRFVVYLKPSMDQHGAECHEFCVQYVGRFSNRAEKYQFTFATPVKASYVCFGGKVAPYRKYAEVGRRGYVVTLPNFYLENNAEKTGLCMNISIYANPNDLVYIK